MKNTLFLLFILTLAFAVFSGEQAIIPAFEKRLTDNDICKISQLSPADGTQNPQGSCSNTIQGEIPNVDHMPSTLIINPENGAVLKANKNFTVTIKTINIKLGEFSDPEKEYYTFPQRLNKHGIIFGHTHIVVQKLDGDDLPDANKFAFFKGLNESGERGILTQDVGEEKKPGLPTGTYRICTMSSSFSHQPMIMPIAKRGSQDDCIRIKIK